VTVGDLQKCLRALAEAIGSARGANKDLEEAAAAMAPFAGYKVEAFARFLKLAEAKYAASGELPDGKPPPAPKAAGAKKEAGEKPSADAFAAAIQGLKTRLGRGEPLDRAAVEAEVSRFSKLTQPQVDGVMAGLGFKSKVKPKADALAAIVTHILAARTASDRAEV
jgi:hypothetical protein